MARHIMAITYKPKIESILKDTCTQTIRKRRKKPFAIGDLILLHGWGGRPYWSRWSWRKLVVISEVIDITIYEDYVYMNYSDDRDIFPCYAWDKMDIIAEADGIEPPTGKELKQALTNGKTIPDEGIKMQIIRW